MSKFCARAWTCHATISSRFCDLSEEKARFGVKHGGTSSFCIRWMVCKHDMLTLVHEAKRYETNICDLNKKRRACVNEAVILHRREQKTAACKNLDSSNRHHKNTFLNFQSVLLSSLSLTNRKCLDDTCSTFFCKSIQAIPLCFYNWLKLLTAANLSSHIEMNTLLTGAGRKKLLTLKHVFLHAAII